MRSPLSPGSSSPAPDAHAAASPRTAWLLLTLAVACWAGNFVAGRALRNDVPAVALTFWRWLLALCLLLPFTWSGIRGQWPVVRRSWKVLWLLGLFASVLQHVPVYLGLRETTATNGALLNATSPMFIVLLSVLVLKERLRPIVGLGMLVSLAGVVVIVSRGDLAVLRNLQLNSGDAWILASAVAWGCYTISLRFRPPPLSGLHLLTLICGASVLSLAPLWALEMAMGRTFAPTLPVIGGILFVGVFASVVAYIAWNRGVAIVGPARAAPFMYLMLVFTPLLSIVLLGEPVRGYHFAGGALIISGIYVATLFRSRT
jgi:drug/metabolite transporter (DMT)-like permease